MDATNSMDIPMEEILREIDPTHSSPLRLKMLVPNASAGVIIGKSGSSISDIQERSGAKVVMSRSQEYYPDTTGNQDRVLLVTGGASQVLSALHLILRKLADDITDPTTAPMMSIRMLIHMKLCGSLIGKNGSTIKSFAEDSKASLAMSPPPTLPGLHERVIKMSGDISSLMRAAALVLTKILSSPSYETLSDETVNYSHRREVNMANIKAGQPHDHFNSPPHKDDWEHSVDIAIPESRTGFVIGKNGVVIKQIQDLLGVAITISEKGRHIVGTDCRPCKISGADPEVLDLAAKIVNLKIEGKI